MNGLLCLGEWQFEDHTIPIFAGSDHRIYARLRDLCMAAGVDFGEQLHAAGEHRLLSKDLVSFGEKCAIRGPKAPEVMYEIYLNFGGMPVWLGMLDPR